MPHLSRKLVRDMKKLKQQTFKISRLNGQYSFTVIKSLIPLFQLQIYTHISDMKTQSKPATNLKYDSMTRWNNGLRQQVASDRSQSAPQP